MDARARELELRSELSLVIATRFGDALDQAADAGQNIEQAIRDAKARIERVRSARKSLEIVASLVSLAAALASGDGKLVKAGKDVADLAWLPPAWISSRPKPYPAIRKNLPVWN
jgi:hypothetical protein